MNTYLVVVWAAPGITSDAVEARLNNEMDWIRFKQMTWFVRSFKSADDLAKDLADVAGQQYVVTEVKVTNSQGLMDSSFWTWVNKGFW